MELKPGGASKEELISGSSKTLGLTPAILSVKRALQEARKKEQNRIQFDLEKFTFDAKFDFTELEGGFVGFLFFEAGFTKENVASQHITIVMKLADKEAPR